MCLYRACVFGCWLLAVGWRLLAGGCWLVAGAGARAADRAHAQVAVTDSHEVDLSAHSGAAELLAAVGAEPIKVALMSIGLKCGGGAPPAPHIDPPPHTVVHTARPHWHTRLRLRGCAAPLERAERLLATKGVADFAKYRAEHPELLPGAGGAGGKKRRNRNKNKNKDKPAAAAPVGAAPAAAAAAAPSLLSFPAAAPAAATAAPSLLSFPVAAPAVEAAAPSLLSFPTAAPAAEAAPAPNLLNFGS